MTLATDRPVLVTGATGYVASQLIADLLARGYKVRGTVRNLSREASHRHVRELPGAAERLELVEANLLDEGSFDLAAQGVDYVMHTASPYTLDVADPERDLVKPAEEGTLNVLRSCKRSSTVKRVVLTSSMAAVTDEPLSGKIYTEADWNGTSSLQRNPYFYSKARAERAAWAFVEDASVGYDLVVINPALVTGPSIAPSLNASNVVFRDLMTGKFPAVIRLTWGIVDVRDVALAHIRAMETPAASGRYLCVAGTRTVADVTALLRRAGYDKGLPKFSLASPLGDALTKGLSYLQPRDVGTYLRTHVGRDWGVDNGKITRELGMEFRAMDETILDAVKDMERWGHLPAKA